MIKAEELKIRNLVYVPSTGQNIPITAINMDLGVWVNRSLGVLGFNQIEPIPLSEERLLKCGFESNNIAYKIDNDRFVFELLFYDAWNLNYVEKQKFGNGSVELSGYWSVHQLQNLFFSLTGEELTVKQEG